MKNFLLIGTGIDVLPLLLQIQRQPQLWKADTYLRDYPQGPFDKAGTKALADLFKKATGENGADVIYDPVGGDYSEAALRSIAWEGRYLVVGFPAGIPSIPLNLALLKGCQIVGVFWGAFTAREPKRDQANRAELLKWVKEGTLKPHVSKTYPLANAAQALKDLAARKVKGKVVLVTG